MTDGLLRVTDLTTVYESASGTVTAVDGINLEISQGETLGIVGESGCGKSATALSIAGLMRPPGRIVRGSIELGGRDLTLLGEKDLRRIRGTEIGFIFQDPMSTLNPTASLGDQIGERARVHLGLSKSAARDRAIDLLERVGIKGAKDRIDDYPHELSGGMRQRAIIAIALACDPRLLIADEPTTALDVTIQAQIVDLIQSLSSGSGMSVILITHDMGVTAGVCDRVNVMYAGRFVEAGLVDEIYESPKMPYTRGLLDSIPSADGPFGRELPFIKGSPPDLGNRFVGCSFLPRCSYARNVCANSEPDLTPRSRVHLARCFGTEEGGWIDEREQ